jgi:DnaJ-domain-containing protein 1
MKYLYILLALLYFLVPYDLLPDFLGALGRVDDLVVLGFLLRYLLMQQKRAGGARGQPGPDTAAGRSGGDPEPDANRFDSNDPYTVLGVERSASTQNIKKAYRELVNKYHPDKVDHLGDEFKSLAAKRFKQIQQAYQSIQQTRR